MYSYIGSTDTFLYDLIGILCLIPLLFFLFKLKKKKETIGLGKTSEFLMNCAIAKYPKNKMTLKLSNEKIWLKIEFLVISIILIWFFLFGGYSFADMFMEGRRTDWYGFSLLMPFVLLVFCLISKINWLKLMDLITPSFAFLSGLLKIGCFCLGCCGTRTPWKYGLYNYSTSEYEFPIQLVEVVVSLILFVALLSLSQKVKTGRLYPIYLIIYSCLRFIYNIFKVRDNVFWILDLEQTTSVVVFVIGIALLVIVGLYDKKIIDFFDKQVGVKYLNKKNRKYMV